MSEQGTNEPGPPVNDDDKTRHAIGDAIDGPLIPETGPCTRVG